MSVELLIKIFAVIGVIATLYALFKIITSFNIVSYYITAKFSETPISFLQILFMKMRKVDVERVVFAIIHLHKNNIKADLADIETAQLAGRNLDNITRGLITAKKHGIELTVKQAIEADRNKTEISNEILKKSRIY